MTLYVEIRTGDTVDTSIDEVDAATALTTLNAETLTAGQTVAFVADMNFGTGVFTVTDSGTLDSPITITSDGGTISQWVDINDGGAHDITFSVVPTWTSQNYVAGDVVYYSTDGNYYCCKLNTVSGNAPSDPTYWYDVGGKTYVGTLPAGLTGNYIASVWIDGVQTYSKRWVGQDEATYTSGWQREKEWGSGPDVYAPTKIYFRGDTSPNTWGEIRVACTTGAIAISATASATPNYITIEDLNYSYVSSPFSVTAGSDATEDLRGFVARRVNGSECMQGARMATDSSTELGAQFAVREWLIEDCHTTMTGSYGFTFRNAGIGIARGCSVKEYSLNNSIGAFYFPGTGVAGTPGSSYACPDEILVENCFASQSYGNYVETGGVGNYWDQDHGTAFYMDNRDRNTTLLSCRAVDVTEGGACHTNSGGPGTTKVIGLEGVNCKNLFLVSDSGSGESHTANIYNSSGVGILDDIISYTSTLPGTGSHIVENVAGESVGTTKYGINNASVGETVTTKNCMYEGVTGTKTGSGTTNETACTPETGLFAASTDVALATASPARYAGTDLVENTPSNEQAVSGDQLHIAHGITDSANFTIAVTISQDAGQTWQSAWAMGQDQTDNYHQINTAVGKWYGRRRISAVDYNTSENTATADSQERVVYRQDDASGNTIWSNGTVCVTPETSLVSTDITSYTLNLLALASGTHHLDGSVSNVIIYDGKLTDAECLLLSEPYNDTTTGTPGTANLIHPPVTSKATQSATYQFNTYNPFFYEE